MIKVTVQKHIMSEEENIGAEECGHENTAG